MRLINLADGERAGDFLGFAAIGKALISSQQARKTALKKPSKFVQHKLDNHMQGVFIYQFSMKIKGIYQMGLCRIKLHPLLSNTFTNEVHYVTENSLVKFQDNIRLGL